MKKKKTLKKIGVVCLLFIFILSLISAFNLIEKIVDLKHLSSTLQYPDSTEERVYFDGNWYIKKHGIENVLILGIDSATTVDGADEASMQADFIAVLSINKLDKTFSVLHINRDTMTDITQLDANGNQYGVFNAQLALAHTYGSTDAVRCNNTVSAVENLLYGTEIDHYFSVTMDAVPILNDSVGGVDVTLTKDFPLFGEEATAGTTITLTGKDALSFVRWRSDDPYNSNLERMERQRLYISALMSRYMNSANESTLKTLMSIDEYVTADYTVDQLSLLFERLRDYTFQGTVSLSGEAKKNDIYVEYYVDETALQKTVVDLFYRLEE